MKLPWIAFLAYIVTVYAASSQVLNGSLAVAESHLPYQPPHSNLSRHDRYRCGNSPHNRSAWCHGFDINTDYEYFAPPTGNVREYWLTVGEYILAPDGFPRPVMAVNGTIPGPTIYADWGDWVVIHVFNNMTQTQNGSTIHWHGIRQHYTNQYDGVPAITQCPIHPGTSMTYKWRATQYGTAWYHSHIGLQAWEGVFGGIIINGPATANYDEDKGMVTLSDWDHSTMSSLYESMQSEGPQGLDNALINGTMMFPNSTTGPGHYFNMSVKENSTYRLRLVNAAVDEGFMFSIDNHTLTVISMDLVPIQPFTTENITITMGQRYDLLITANQRAIANSFWMRALPLSACQVNDNAANIRGFIYYDTPTPPPESSYTPFVENCDDPPLAQLVPYIPKNVGNGTVIDPTYVNVTVARTPAANNFFRWYLNNNTMKVSWDDPSLMQIYTSMENFTAQSNVVELANATTNEWVYLLIETPIPVYHPIHLHGHDFYIISQGSGHWDAATTLQNPKALQNPPRRDTAMLPQNGHLLLAWKIDNPGVWLMHCHIGWHVQEGFALQFIELRHQIPRIVNPGPIQRVCNRWSGVMPWDDSGV